MTERGVRYSWSNVDLEQEIWRMSMPSELAFYERIDRRPGDMQCPKCADDVDVADDCVCMHCADDCLIHTECAVEHYCREEESTCMLCGQIITPAHINSATDE